MPVGHTMWSWVGRGSRPGTLPFLESKSGVPKVSRVHSLLVNLKHMSWN